MLVKPAEEGEVFRAGSVYIAVTDKHLMVKTVTFPCSDTARVNFVRPAADELFTSVAANCQARGIAVVLAGSGRNCLNGAQEIRKQGGTVIAQDKASSENFRMPKAAIDPDEVNFVLPLKEIAPTLVRLVMPENTSAQLLTHSHD